MKTFIDLLPTIVFGISLWFSLVYVARVTSAIVNKMSTDWKCHFAGIVAVIGWTYLYYLSH